MKLKTNEINGISLLKWFVWFVAYGQFIHLFVHCIHNTIFLFHAKREMWTTFDFPCLCSTALTHSLCTKTTIRCFDSPIHVSIELNYCSSKPYDAYLILKRNEIICTNMSTTPTKIAVDDAEEFDWIQLSKDLRDPTQEEFTDKFWRKVKSNPFVPIGMLQV